MRLSEGVTSIISHTLLYHLLLVLATHDDIVSGSHGLILLVFLVVSHLLLHLIDLIVVLQLKLLLIHLCVRVY